MCRNKRLVFIRNSYSLSVCFISANTVTYLKPTYIHKRTTEQTTNTNKVKNAKSYIIPYKFSLTINFWRSECYRSIRSEKYFERILSQILIISDRNEVSRSSKKTGDIIILYTRFSGSLGRKKDDK
jgi:hypothetical protein